MSVEHTETLPTRTKSRIRGVAPVFIALALSGLFSVQQLAAQNLTQAHYRWRNDDGGELVGIAAEETVIGSTTGATSFTLTSWTPGANELVLVAVALRDETLTVTVSGNGLTFDEIADVDNVDGVHGIHLFRAMGSAPATGSITASIPGNSLAAVAGSSDANHLNTLDLVAGGFQLNWTCYNDGADPSPVKIEEPWVTGPTHCRESLGPGIDLAAAKARTT